MSKWARIVSILLAVVVVTPLMIYFFSQNPEGAKAVSTISSSGSSAAQPSQRQIVQSSNGTIVAVFADTGGIFFSKSTDNAATWSTPTTITTASSSDISIAIDGNDHIYMVYASGVGDVNSHKLTYSAGNWSAGGAVSVFGSLDCIPGSSSGFSQSEPTITVNSSNAIWVNAIRTNNDISSCAASTSLATTSSANGTTWTESSGIDSFPSTFAPILAIGTDLWTIVGGTNATNSGIWKDAGSLGSWTKITGNTTLPAQVSLASAGSDQLDLLYKNGSNAIVYRKYTISTTTLGSEVTISSVANDIVGAISANATNGNLWAFYQSYVAASSYNVVYKKFNGTSWDGSATGITTDNLNNVGISSVVKRAGATYIPLLWQAGATSTLKAHAVSTAASGSAPAAPTLSSPPSGATGVVHRPHFELRTTDADGDYLKYKIEVCSTSNCSAVVSTIDQTASQTGWAGQDLQTGSAYTGSATLASSTMAQHNYQNPPLAVSTQYWWRAYAIDPAGGNTFSSASPIFTFTTAAAIPIQFQPNTTIRGGTKIN